MLKNLDSQSAFYNSRVLFACALCSVGVGLAMFSFAVTLHSESPHKLSHSTRVGGANHLLSGLRVSSAAAPTATPDPLDLPQVTAEAPPRVPATASCAEDVLTHTFANSYYAPGFGQHLSTTCPGPWAAVVLNIDVSVSGVQFDRIFDIYAGPV